MFVLRVECGNAGESARLDCTALKHALNAGEVDSTTPLRLAGAGKDGGWQPWATFGAYAGAYAGFRAALSLPEPDEEEVDDETINFWNQLSFRYKVEYDETEEGSAGENAVFGHMRQKVLKGEITDATLIQIQDPDTGKWGDWVPLAEARDMYDGLSSAVGKQIAEDTLAEYKAAFSVFDKDGDGTISAEELGTVMKALGRETGEEELAEMMAQVPASNTPVFGTVHL